MFFDNASKPYDIETTKTEKSSMEIYIGSNDSQHERLERTKRTSGRGLRRWGIKRKRHSEPAFLLLKCN